jgi:hypothetical protein
VIQFDDMPRAAQSDDAPKRSPRKRATTTRTTAERVPRRTAPRKRAPRVSDGDTAPVERVETVIESRPTERRAPTPIAATKARARNRQLQMFVTVIIIVLGVGASAAVGVTDEGQIDVVKTIEERNERIRSGQGTEQEINSMILPVQNTNERLPDGGLRGRGVGTAPAAAAPDPLASTTASTTDATASSTDATASSTEDGTESASDSNEEAAPAGEAPAEAIVEETPVIEEAGR